MNLPRRHFLGSSLVVLGSTLVDALATPLWRWAKTPLLTTATAANSASSLVTFVDVAREAGLTAPNVWGGVDHKKYIIEAKGSGLAFFDYDNDGWLDVYLTNGTRFDTNWPPGQAPTSHLYKNNRDGTFNRCHGEIRVGVVRAGKRASAWATTTMTARMTCSVVFGDITFCSITMVTEPSPM